MQNQGSGYQQKPDPAPEDFTLEEGEIVRYDNPELPGTEKAKVLEIKGEVFHAEEHSQDYRAARILPFSEDESDQRLGEFVLFYKLGKVETQEEFLDFEEGETAVYDDPDKEGTDYVRVTLAPRASTHVKVRSMNEELAKEKSVERSRLKKTKGPPEAREELKKTRPKQTQQADEKAQKEARGALETQEAQENQKAQTQEANQGSPEESSQKSSQKKETKDQRITVRVTATEKREIERRAAAKGLSVSRLLAESALSDGEEMRSKEEREALMEALGDYFEELGRIGGNINQIASRVSSGEKVPGEAIRRASEAVEQASDAVLELMEEVSS